MDLQKDNFWKPKQPAKMHATATLTFLVGLVAGSSAAVTGPVAPYVNLGTTDAVGNLLDRQLPGARAHFALALAATCTGSAPPCFSLEDGPGGVVKVTATGAAELASGKLRRE